jgi:hypothetical protein
MSGTTAVEGLKKSDLEQFDLVTQQAIISLAGEAGFSVSNTMSSVKNVEFDQDKKTLLCKMEFAL